MKKFKPSLFRLLDVRPMVLVLGVLWRFNGSQHGRPNATLVACLDERAWFRRSLLWARSKIRQYRQRARVSSPSTGIIQPSHINYMLSSTPEHRTKFTQQLLKRYIKILTAHSLIVHSKFY